MNADGPWMRLHLLRGLEIRSLSERFLTIFRDLGEGRVKNRMLILTTILTAGGISLVDATGQLKSGVYYITQSWSQETAFKRPYNEGHGALDAISEKILIEFLEGKERKK